MATHGTNLSLTSRRLIACGLVLLTAAVGYRLWRQRSALQTGASANAPAPRGAGTDQGDALDRYIAHGVELVGAGRLDEATALFNEANRANPNDYRPPLWLGLIAIRRGDPASAVGLLEEARRRDGQSPDVCQALGELYERLGTPERAVPLYELTVRARPNEAAEWRLLGLADLRIGRLARGRDALQKATTLDRTDTRALQGLASVDLRLGLAAEARDLYNGLLTKSPDDAAALTGFAQSTLMIDPSAEGLSNAKHSIDRALAQKGSPQSYAVRGHLLLLQRRYPEAILDLKRAVAGQPDNETAYGHLAQAYAASGRPELARQATEACARAQAAKAKQGAITRQ